MQITSELAEIAGAFAANGCLQKDYLCMWGNITEDREYYDTVLVPLFESCFNVKLKPHEKKSNSVYGFYLCNKNVVKIFNEFLGFPVGSKTYTVRVPKIILNSNSREIQASFVRGYADGDGCLNFHKRYGKYKEFSRKHNVYPRIILISVSKDLIIDVATMVEAMGITCNISTARATRANEKDAHRLWLRGRERVEKWLDLINFKNPVHLSKVLIWQKYGFVPTNICLSERYKILKGENAQVNCARVAQSG